MNNKKFTAKKEMRLDVFLSEELNETRNQIEQLIAKVLFVLKIRKKQKLD